MFLSSKRYITRQGWLSIPSSCISSFAASFSFCFNFSRDSSGNQSRMKLSIAQSTFAEVTKLISEIT